MTALKVLVVEDSAYQRLRIAEALRESSLVAEVEVVATGEEAIRRILSTRFDLVTLDLGLPGMDGHAVLRWIMANRPLPVVVVSGDRQERSALAALEAGAFDFIVKASARADVLERFQRRLLEAVEEARQISIEPLLKRSGRAADPPAAPTSRARARGRAQTAPRPVPGGGEPALVVAASTGGPPALRDLFLALGPQNAVVAVAQHMPAPFTRSLASRLSQGTGWDVREAADGAEAVPGVVWIAPGGHHLELAREGRRAILRVLPHHPSRRWCPSGDLLFASAADAFGARSVGVVLTGMGDDAAEGARAIAAAGGTVICEARETAVIPGMPDSAARAVPGAARVPLPAIASEVERTLARL